jgi:tryptophanyl-tRNA synthetase
MPITRFLTGITTSGTPHLGNYVGSIRPSVAASLRPDVESFYFLADYHSLIKIDQPERIAQSTLEIAASWLACGLDPNKVVFYRQSDIPEIPELSWFLTCVVGKGVLNRAHAYKAVVDKNAAAGLDADADVNAGLFMYPVLMGADILMFNAHKVPVGRDQVQHLEMARDMAYAFNHRYGEHFVAPQEVIDDQVATLPGLDGRKMSKSYDNTIPLFADRERLKKLIFGILTDSKAPGQAKATGDSALFQIYRAFASPEETNEFAREFEQGIAWSLAKEKVFLRLDQELAPLRDNYHALMSSPSTIESLLQSGAAKARAIATPFMVQLRHAVGLRALGSAGSKPPATTEKVALAQFKQYREADGKFYFKLTDAKGQVLLQSQGFASGREAGVLVKRLQTEGAAALSGLAGQVQMATEVDPQAVIDALTALLDSQSD